MRRLLLGERSHQGSKPLCPSCGFFQQRVPIGRRARCPAPFVVVLGQRLVQVHVYVAGQGINTLEQAGVNRAQPLRVFLYVLGEEGFQHRVAVLLRLLCAREHHAAIGLQRVANPVLPGKVKRAAHDAWNSRLVAAGERGFGLQDGWLWAVEVAFAQYSKYLHIITGDLCRQQTHTY